MPFLLLFLPCFFSPLNWVVTANSIRKVLELTGSRFWFWENENIPFQQCHLEYLLLFLFLFSYVFIINFFQFPWDCSCYLFWVFTVFILNDVCVNVLIDWVNANCVVRMFLCVQETWKTTQLQQNSTFFPSSFFSGILQFFFSFFFCCFWVDQTKKTNKNVKSKQKIK